MAPHMQTSLVQDALRMAWFRRRPGHGVIFHSDRGSQYCSHEFQRTMRDWGMRSSMSRKGNCWVKACVSHYTSSRRSETTSGWRRRQDILTPIAFLGGLLPGGSYRHSFLSL
jgi:putative transposase